ncbi:hypothetical protein QT381_09940 [Galbitalea sp. SE-J8]|uniref:hypothetical protein n=1 Tax=Galbitalea sp. SE-J8 TaxID=3054952 RepID=UPI00259C6F8A|nr:hypothetical protein [Galbitalea sp. SE-J8]MDM4763327.1 hypothetical protein [Galbitalea sp. SE-J8]
MTTTDAADRAAIETGVRGYERAWRSNDPAEIAALFTVDALYFRRPGPERPGV